MTMVEFRDSALRAFLLAIPVLFCGCHAEHASDKPSIEFTKVPPAQEGGPVAEATIEGRVLRARPGQQLVLYARSGQWWVQPYTSQPFTQLQADSKWSNTTHLGYEYAALLVDSGYRPPATMNSLPPEGGPIAAIATAKGAPTQPSVAKTIHFSGYDWNVRSKESNRAGGITEYDPDNVWIDGADALHLRIGNDAGKSTAAEVSLTRSLGYGLYRFVVLDSSHLEPAAVLSMYTWDDSAPEENHREIDVEITQWGDPRSKNAQYTIQPYYVPENVSRFMEPPGLLTHSFQWEPGKVSFRTVRGTNPGGESKTVASHVFTSGTPAPGGETVHLDFYVFGGAGSTLKKQNEVVIEKFEYLP
jgi:hypothetical protein